MKREFDESSAIADALDHYMITFSPISDEAKERFELKKNAYLLGRRDEFNQARPEDDSKLQIALEALKKISLYTQVGHDDMCQSIALTALAQIESGASKDGAVTLNRSQFVKLASDYCTEVHVYGLNQAEEILDELFGPKQERE